MEEQQGIKDYEAAVAQATDPRVKTVLESILAQEREHVKALQALPENTNYQTPTERQNQGQARYGERRTM